jgi:hypothetical protein
LSNPPHSDPPRRQNALFNSWNKGGSGRKRTYRDLNNIPDDPAAQLQAEIEAAAAGDQDEHTPKKSRGAEWPLSPSLEGRDSATSSKGSRTPRNASLRSRWRMGKSSRFLEGSMRDRESDAPPEQFLREESAMEEYADGHTGEGHAVDDSTPRASVDTNMSFDAGIERVRPSSMYRFGKVLASAFTPSFWFKEKSTPSPAKSPTHDLLEQRKTMAEQRYAELKKSGFQGTQKFGSARSSTDHSHRDSGVDMASMNSQEQKRDGRVFDENGVPFLRPPPIPDDGMLSPGLVSENGSCIFDSVKRTHKRRPSMPSLRKVKSHFSLGNLKHHDPSPTSPLPSIEHDDHFSRIRKKQSKKDLQKQQKLSKRISNLESQLEKAKWELHKTTAVDDVVIKREEEDAEDEQEEEADLDDIDEDVTMEEARDEDDGATEHHEDGGLKDEQEGEEAQEALDDLPPFRRPSVSPIKRYVPTLPSVPSERLLFAQEKNASLQGRALPALPKTAYPDPIAHAMELKLGMHPEEVEIVGPKKRAASRANSTAPRKQIESAVAEKSAATKNETIARQNASTKKQSPPSKTPLRGLRRVVSKASLTGAGVKKSMAKSSTAKAKAKDTATKQPIAEEAIEPNVTAEGEDNAVATSEIPEPKEEAPKKSPRKRRKSSGSKEDKPFKPGKGDDDDDAEWKVASKANKKVQPSRRTGLRRTSGGSEAAEAVETSTASKKKENVKPRVGVFKTPAAARSIDNVLARDHTTSGETLGLSTRTPSGKVASDHDSIISPASTIEDPSLFANATAFAPDTPKGAGPAELDGTFASSSIPLSPDTAKRALRSMSPPPTATFTKLAKAGASTESLPAINEDKVEASLKSRGSTAVPLPSGSPIRGRRQSPKPALKRAGHEGPIMVTPGKRNARGVPPVPKVPEGVEGRRSVIAKRSSPEEWRGWDDDVF